jgi:hypothetical protein
MKNEDPVPFLGYLLCQLWRRMKSGFFSIGIALVQPGWLSLAWLIAPWSIPSYAYLFSQLSQMWL